MNYIIPVYSQEEGDEDSSIAIYDSKLKIEKLIDNFDLPTNIGFLDTNDVLVYESSGNVQRVINGDTIDFPILTFKNSNNVQIIMKAIVAKEKNNFEDNITHDVFFYYVQCNINSECKNNVSKYELDNKNQKLINPIVLVSIPSISNPSHIEGIFRIGTDNNLYLNIASFEDETNRKLSSGTEKVWLECIIKYDKNTNYREDNFYKNKLVKQDNGHGMRYSFGTDYDPYSGQLWYLENDKFKGEINILETSLNHNLRNIDQYDVINGDNFFCIEKIYQNNVKLIGTDETSYKSLIFLDSLALGKRHVNNLFVISDSNEIFEFNLPGNRNELSLASNRENLDDETRDKFLFADGFKRLVDLQINPYDGTLYVADSGLAIEGLETEDMKGSIYKIDRNVDSDSWFYP